MSHLLAQNMKQPNPSGCVFGEKGGVGFPSLLPECTPQGTFSVSLPLGFPSSSWEWDWSSSSFAGVLGGLSWLIYTEPFNWDRVGLLSLRCHSAVIIPGIIVAGGGYSGADFRKPPTSQKRTCRQSSGLSRMFLCLTSNIRQHQRLQNLNKQNWLNVCALSAEHLNGSENLSFLIWRLKVLFLLLTFLYLPPSHLFLPLSCFL